MDFTNILVTNGETGEKAVHVEVAPGSVNEMLAACRAVIRRYHADREASEPEIERDFVVNLSLGEALRRTGLQPIVTPDIHVDSYPERDAPFEFDALVVERPVLTLSSVEPIEVHVNRIIVDEEYVSRKLSSYMERFARYEEAESHTVGMGDFVLVDMTTLKDGAPHMRLCGQGKVLEVDYGDMPEAFIDQLVGMHVGETRTIEYELPRDRPISEDDVDHYTSKVKIDKQLVVVQQEINDEWVSENFEQLKTVDEFLERFKDKVTKDAEEANLDALSRQANLEIEHRLIGSIPDKLYEITAKQQMDEFEKELKQRGKSMDDYLDENETNMEELSFKLFARAGEGLRQAFALETLFDIRHMNCEAADLDLAAQHVFRDNRPEEWYGPDRQRNYPLVMSAAKRMKALEWLVDTAHVLPAGDGEGASAARSR